jgi:hypothetical protein
MNSLFLSAAMSRRVEPNRAPHSNSKELSSLNWFIHQEQDLLADFRKLEIASQRDRERVADKCVTLRRTITSTHALHDAGSRIQSSNDSFIDRLTAELNAQESDIAGLSECLPSTSTFIRGWKAVKNAAIALHEALVEQLASIDQHATAIEEELEVTKELSEHLSCSIEILSPAMIKLQKNIAARSKGLLHPIRRVPAEILQQIFEECVDAEAAEWFVDPTRPPMLFQSATRIAGTCRFWRTIAQQTPRMWNRLRAPTQLETSKNITGAVYRTVGREAFCESLRLCGSIPLEVTVPDSVSTPEELNLTSLKIDRLNFYNAGHYGYGWVTSPWLPLPFPSPRHLWAGNGHRDYPFTITLPPSLISRTTTITVHNITVTIPQGVNLVTQLILCGVQNRFRLTSLLESLPYLAELDAGRSLVKGQYEQDHRALTHQNLKHLRIPISCMHALEGYLGGGLQLPSLSCFGLANHSVPMHERHDPLYYTPSSFPSVSAQLPTTVTHLEVHGEHAVTTSSTTSLIETFHKVDTISTYGSAVGAILRVLCRTRDMPVNEKSNEKENLPSSIQALHIHDYLGDGEDLYPALHQIYNDTEPIKIFFENCPNILPTIRREFTHVVTTAA